MQDDEFTGQGDDDAISEKSDEDEANPLVVPLAEAPKLSKDHLSKQWFSQDVFDGVDDGEELSDDEEAIAKMRKNKKAKAEAEIDADGDVDMGGDVPELPVNNGSADVHTRSASAAGKGDFEIAPQEGDVSSSDSDSDSEDDNGKAEILAYAKKMLKKRSREGILDDAYNRYTFNDEDMPRWFAEDEKKHNRPEKPVTKEEVEAMKVLTRYFSTQLINSESFWGAHCRSTWLHILQQNPV